MIPAPPEAEAPGLGIVLTPRTSRPSQSTITKYFARPNFGLTMESSPLSSSTVKAILMAVTSSGL